MRAMSDPAEMSGRELLEAALRGAARAADCGSGGGGRRPAEPANRARQLDQRHPATASPAAHRFLVAGIAARAGHDSGATCRALCRSAVAPRASADADGVAADD